MRRLIFHIVCFSVLLVSAAQARLFNGEEFYLPNGMQVIVVPNHKAPIVKHMVWYKSGSVDEAPGKGGSAHLLEHLMFRGTAKVPGDGLNKILEQNGAESNAFTSTDMTAYHQMTDISRLELAMALEADRMQNLKLRDKDFALERDIVYQERKERVDNNPAGYFNETLRRVLWQNHPYARPVTGTPEEIMSLTKEDMEAFYKSHYAPNNAVLVLSGDIDAATARQLAEKYYGPLKKRPLAPRPEMPRLEPSFKAFFTMEQPKVNSIRVGKIFAAPSYNIDPQDIYNLTVLSAYMGEGETSKLYKKLVLRDEKALDVSTAYDSGARGYGTFSISAVPAPGISGEELLEAIDDAWAEAIRELTPAEVDKIKTKMRAGLVYLRDNPEHAAYIAGSLAAIGMPLNEIEKQADEIDEVKASGVKKSAEKLWKHAPQASGILKPQKELTPSGTDQPGKKEGRR